jgi:folate receptor
MLGYFQIGMSGYIQNVPVCASYCDAWFEACRNDFTCVEDWLADFDYALDGNNSCPVNSSCVTFERMYGNAEGLCNRMWGVAFFYSTDTDNCTVMAFNNTMRNPNYRLSFPSTSGSGSQSTVKTASTVVVYGTITMMSLLIAALV